MRDKRIGVSALCGILACGCGTSGDNNDGVITPFDFATGVVVPGDDMAAPAHDLAGPTQDMASTDLARLLDGPMGPDLFVIDTTGPAIVINTPGAGTWVRGTIQIQATVTDESGVDPASVVAEFGGDPMYAVPLADAGAGVFLGLFDTRLLPPAFVLPVVSVRAADKRGNKNEVSVTVIVDNVGPAISLSAPPIHVVTVQKGPRTQVQNCGSGQQEICSHPFPPLGDDAATDGQVVQQVMTLRARVEDRANWAPGIFTTYPSLVDPKAVKLYVAPASYGDLVVDTDKDGICDGINPALVPDPNVQGGNKAVEVVMAPISPGGAVDNRGAFGGDGVCAQVGDPMITDGPAGLCGHDLSYVLGYTFTRQEPSIWSIPPILGAPDPRCLGLQFDGFNNLPEGPLCVAVVATDNAGNRNVGAPLRLCLDRGGGKCNNFNLLPDCGTLKCAPGVKPNTWVKGQAPQVPYPAGEVICRQ